MLVESLDLVPSSKKGWTYVLVSPNKKMMKIGRTVQPLDMRLRNIRSEKSYCEHGLEFFLAVEDCRHENTLLSYFGEFRARYNWHDNSGITENLTFSEAWRFARDNVIANHGRIRKIDTIYTFRKHVQVTRLELFKIPPIKIGGKLKALIVEAIEKRG